MYNWFAARTTSERFGSVLWPREKLDLSEEPITVILLGHAEKEWTA